MKKSLIYVGWDVHKETLTVAVAKGKQQAARGVRLITAVILAEVGRRGKVGSVCQSRRTAHGVCLLRS